MPTLTTSTPAERRPSDSAPISSGPDRRPPRATTTAAPPCARTSLPNARPIERAASASSVLPITPRMSYALKMDLEIMLAHLRAMENFDRHIAEGSVKLPVKPNDARWPEAIRFQLIIAPFGHALIDTHSNA